MKHLKGAAVVLMALVALGCGGQALTAGRVVEKEHRPAYTSVYYQRIGNITVPQATHIPPAWYVVVENCDRAEPGCWRDRWHVNEDWYHAHTLGEWVTR